MSRRAKNKGKKANQDKNDKAGAEKERINKTAEINAKKKSFVRSYIFLANIVLYLPWHFLYLTGFPVAGSIFPHGQGSLRPTLGYVLPETGGRETGLAGPKP